MSRRRQRISAAERDRLIRDYEHAAYQAVGTEPEEMFFDGPAAGTARSVRVVAFNQSSAGPPVILLHGIASVSVLAAPLLPYLHDRPVYAVDWPGHGLSGPSVLSPGMPFRTHAVSVIKSLIEQIGADRVDLVGHSLGAQISLYSALDLGHRVRRIVLLGAPGAGFPATRPLPVMKLLAIPGVGETLLRVPMSRRTFAHNNDMALGKGALDQLPAELVEAAFLLAGRTSNAPSIASFFRGLVRRGSLRPGVTLDSAELGRLLQPTLMCWGDEDVFLTALQGAVEIVSLRDVRLVRLVGAGHAPWLQAPAVVGQAIAGHLSGGAPEITTPTSHPSPGEQP